MPVIPPTTLLIASIGCLAGCGQDQGATTADAGFDARAFDAGVGSALVIVDLDGDGHLDAVTSQGPDSLLVFRGDGSGGLESVAAVEAGQHAVEGAAGDLNGDGFADVVVANHETRYVTPLFGDGTGVLAAGDPISVDVDPHVHAVLPRDMDGDSLLDLVVDDRNREAVLILRGMRGGGFEAGVRSPVGGDPYRGFSAGDLDGDGRLDLVTPNPREVGVLLGSPEGDLSLRPVAPVPAAAPFGVALLDLNGDGRLDLVAGSNERSELVEVFLGNGDATFREHSDSPFVMGAGPKRIATGDFDGDGFADAAVSSWQSPVVLLVFGGERALRTESIRTVEHPWGLAAADMNEDGRDDLLVADDTSPALVLYLRTEH